MLRIDKNEYYKYAIIDYFSPDDPNAGPQAAQNAIKEMNGIFMNGKKLKAELFLIKKSRQ